MRRNDNAENIDYGNFKSRVHDGTFRDEAYMGCWSAMVEAQEAQARGEG